MDIMGIMSTLFAVPLFRLCVGEGGKGDFRVPLGMSDDLDSDIPFDC